MRVFVTGGAGYIGSHVVKQLGQKGFDVLTFDNLSTGNRWAVIYGEFIKGDLSDKPHLEAALEEFLPDVVVHLAASVMVCESVKDPLSYYRNNTVNTLNLLEVMLKKGINKLVFSSTAAVYGEVGSMPINEETPLRPINPYGRSKMMAEMMLKDIGASATDFRYVSLRYFNVAGADKDREIGQAHKKSTHLITMALKAAMGKIDRLNIFGTDYPTKDGTCIRDYIHVDDIASAHLLAIDYLIEGGKSDVFNCGYGYGFSVKEVVSAVKKVTGVDFEVVETDRRQGDPAVLISDNHKIKRVLGWTPQFDDLQYIIKTAWQWETTRKG